MDFRKVLKMEKNKNEVFLGNNEEGHFLLNIDLYPSVVITGETGAGKSILLDQIILQLMNTYTSLEMGLILIDTSGVELNYYQNTNYTLTSVFNDEAKSIVVLSRILKEIERRKKIIYEAKVTTVNEYNKTAKAKLPLLVVALDDNKSLLKSEDMEHLLSGIISELAGLGIVFLLVTGDVHTPFFETDLNTLASTLITFDFASPEESSRANLFGAEKLKIGEFILRQKGVNKVLQNYEFDDAIIQEMVER